MRSWRGLAALLVAALGTACIGEDTIRCDDGSVCAAGTACRVGGGCAPTAAVEACAGLVDGSECRAPGVEAGVCAAGVCVALGCGNGVLEPDEVCDDGNQLAGDGCSADCGSAETCGNGIIDQAVGEGCDDGNTVDGDACQSTCRIPQCGDGVVDAAFNEACDDGAANSTAPDAGCRPNCQPARCGDGVHDPARGEVCDDGAQASGDGCSFDCLSLEVCGNEYPDFITGEQCDHGAGLSGDGCASQCRVEELGWRPVSSAPAAPSARYDLASDYDTARGELVVFGGADPATLALVANDTWAWRDGRWVALAPAHAPPARSRAAMAFDQARGRMVLFGGAGVGATVFGDTWLFDGVDWSPLDTVGGPAPSAAATMAYDVGLGEIVLFGAGATGDETWRFDGTAWAFVEAQTRPPPGGVVRYVPSLGSLALVTRGAAAMEVWLFDGATWTLRPASNPPSRRLGFGLAYDPIGERLVLAGGHVGSFGLAETWFFDGVAWTQGAGAAFTARTRTTATLDPRGGGVVLLGGKSNDRSTGTVLDSAWELVGDGWIERVPTASLPPARTSAAMAYLDDRAAVLLFGGGYVSSGGAPPPRGGHDDTWVRTDRWREITTSPSPGGRFGAALAYHPRLGLAVLFGGNDGGGFFYDDTWTFDGATWHEVTGATGPTWQPGAALAFDPTAQALVLATPDGAAIGAPITTWTFDGATWAPVSTAHAPSALTADRVLVADVRHQRLVLVSSVDAWAFDGVDWTPLDAITPSGTVAHASFDARLGGVVVLGKIGTYWATWLLGATGWTLLEAVDNPTVRSTAGFIHDAVTGDDLLFGASDQAGFDTWELGYRASSSGVAREACLSDQDVDGDGLAGCDDPDCWGRCQPRCPPATSCTPAPGGPIGCGDGVCDPSLEVLRLCAVDCDQCGDGVCAPGFETEASCPADCETCGDFACGAGETPTTCAADCPGP
ncbi:MAG: hypothetical protein R2939_21730 [Kofleriaceae bacterium]